MLTGHIPEVVEMNSYEISYVTSYENTNSVYDRPTDRAYLTAEVDEGEDVTEVSFLEETGIAENDVYVVTFEPEEEPKNCGTKDNLKYMDMYA